MERIRPHGPVETGLGPAPRPYADTVTDVAVTLAAAEVGIGGRPARLRAEAAIPLATAPPSPLQAEGRATKGHAAGWCAAVAEADPGVAEGQPAEAEVGAAVTQGLQAAAAPRRMAAGTPLGTTCRVPLAASDVRPFLLPCPFQTKVTPALTTPLHSALEFGAGKSAWHAPCSIRRR